MPEFLIRDMEPEDEYFVSTCSHINESEEQDACGLRRAALFRELARRGLVIKVARINEEPIGFAYGIPIEQASWGPLGEGLMSLPCLYVLRRATGHGIGRALLEAIEVAARKTNRSGLTVTGFRNLPGAEWFMPADYFESCGFSTVDTRGSEVLLWKPFSSEARPPCFLCPSYRYSPVSGKVSVDLFWNGFCQTSNIEAQRVRKVCAEFGDSVRLTEYCAEERDILLCHQISRAIYVNGREIFWGYEAPKDGIREAVRRAMAEVS